MRSEEEVRNKFNDIRGFFKAYKFQLVHVMTVKQLIDKFEAWMFNEETKNDD